MVKLSVCMKVSMRKPEQIKSKLYVLGQKGQEVIISSNFIYENQLTQLPAPSPRSQH